jgi:uncharacterized caspase-like protein
MTKNAVAALLCGLLLPLFSSAAKADKRVALIIGNSAYQNAPALPNPAKDARAMAAAFQKAGFDAVSTVYDAGNLETKRAIRKFEDTAADSDVAVVYFAGHGIEIHGINYLIPVDAKLASDRDADDEAVTLDRLVESLDGARRLRVVILDACRDNPFVRKMQQQRVGALRGVKPGLGATEPTDINTLIAYAAKAGSEAEDGDGEHSPFAAALMNNLFVPGLDIRLAFGRVRDEVLKQTANRQEPFVYGSLGGGNIALAPSQTGSTATTAPPVTDEQANLEITFWNSIKNDKNQRLFEAYLNRYPNGAFADIARIALDDLKAAALTPPAPLTDDSVPITDPTTFNEVRERLYELNFDTGAVDGPINDSARQAIREFQQQSNLPSTGIATMGLLRRLREIGGLKPWGVIVYGKDNGKWGMAWGESTRKAAVARARASCGDAKACPVEISFFGTECGVFAHSGAGWAITARDDIGKAKDVALTDCRKHGKSCQIIASVCADGAERFSAAN